MALHPDFPDCPYVPADPEVRWLPGGKEGQGITGTHPMPPLILKLRREVKQFRDGGYVGASATSKSLLNWWFVKPHLLHQPDDNAQHFRYYFAQREAVETIIYLYDVKRARDKHDLIRFDSSGNVASRLFHENWRRYVVKMATGTGKTKVMSLILAWSFYHRLYETDSELARNFLVIAPNIIVLDRLYHDFQGLKIFYEDPVLPENGYDGYGWRDDFQLILHKQDDIRTLNKTGNIFLSNIHRVYRDNKTAPSPEDENSMDYFLGKRPTGGTTDPKADLGMIVRDIDELVILNDEAHHIHDPKMEWFKSIEDINNQLVHRGKEISLQVDVTATPKDTDGNIFVQIVSDYPLVEAITQNVVKCPVLPDTESREKLNERQSVKFTDKYVDYLELGVIEWRKAYMEHKKLGKTAILFVMTDDTKNCDDVAAYLESYPDFEGAVLTIHTIKNGEIAEVSSGKKKAELESLRQQANKIDSSESPYKAIVSVLMLKEGWDVKNVTTIVGLRAFSAASNVLPEQTLGRGLRKMYQRSFKEYVSVIGTDAFMKFVESIQAEGVTLERRPMGLGVNSAIQLIIEVDRENERKNIDALDIDIPVLAPKANREYEDFETLDESTFSFDVMPYKHFTEKEQQKITFREMTTNEIVHETIMDRSGSADYRSVIGFFAQTVKKELKLVSGYDIVYKNMRSFIKHRLFGESVELDSPNTLRNLAEPAVTRMVIGTFKKEINLLTVREEADTKVRDSLRLSGTKPFLAENKEYTIPQKSIFNYIIGDSKFELEFAEFLERCDDVFSYAKNYLAIGFKLDYINAEGGISNYYPDFIVKLTDARIMIIETKGLEDQNVPPKMVRLRQWCEDINDAQSHTKFDFVFVEYDKYKKHPPKSFSDLLKSFTTYRK